MKPGITVRPLTSITSAPAGIATAPLLPTALNLPASIMMTQLSIGARPVPSISLPPCTTSIFSVTISSPPWSHQLTTIYYFAAWCANHFHGSRESQDVVDRMDKRLPSLFGTLDIVPKSHLQ